MKTAATLLIMLGLTMLSACTVEGPTSVSNDMFARATRNVTWDVTGTLQPTGETCGNSGYSIAVTASGNLSHLGTSSSSGMNCVEPTAFYYGNPVAGTNTFTAVVTAANGDELWMSTTGEWQVTSASPVEVAQRGTYTITGGTGRFEDASGSGVYAGTQYGNSTDSDNRIEITFTGTLTY